MQFRCVQVDLCRQKEPVEFLRQFIEFAAEHHYNMMMLNLGARIRTDSFPYPNESDSYTCDEIRGIVEHGRRYGIEVFPSLPTLGHGEDFLAHPELEELAELRNGKTGRWGDSANIDFCASNDRVFQFFETYFSEIAELFPSQFFHIGFDEAWNIGYCELCSVKAKTFQGEAELCLSALLRIHAILRKLGKKIMMWDDMFEYYPGILERVPRDIIMVNWQYQGDVRRYEAHFVDLAVEHRLRRYDSLGLEYWIAPADYKLGNIRTFCEYANSYHASGALLTLWGKHVFFHPKSFPAVAYAGHLFAGRNESEAWNAVVDDTLNGRIPRGGAEEKALRMILEGGWLHGNMILNEMILRCLPFFGRDAVFQTQLELADEVLKPYFSAEDPVLNDLLCSLAGVILREKIRSCFQKFMETAESYEEFRSELDLLMTEIEKLKAERKNFWRSVRHGILPCKTEIFDTSVQETCLCLAEKLKTKRWFRIRFALPVQYGAPKTTLSVRSRGKWIALEERVYKMTRFGEDDWDRALFDIIIPTDLEEPDAVKLEVSAFGGTGICFVEYGNGSERKTPDRILETSGTVRSPEYLLDDDMKVCHFGRGNIHADFADRNAASIRHTVVMSMK